MSVEKFVSMTVVKLTGETRMNVIGSLEQLILKWAQDLLKSRNEHQYDKCDVLHLQVIGSERMEIRTKEGDIDILVMCPPTITSDDFFATFFSLLQSDSRTEDSYCVQSAVVPIMKFNWLGYKIDLLFVSLSKFPLPSVGSAPPPPLPQPIDHTNIFCFAEEGDVLPDQAIRAITGWRVIEVLPFLIPHYPRFQQLATYIKQWARIRGVYSNSGSYLGGISWVILCAKVCQLNPMSSLEELIIQFFSLYISWPWPDPVTLLDLRTTTDQYDHMVWQPNPAHVMPILTPVYPAQNTAVNVNPFSLQTLIREFQNAHSLLSRHMTPLDILQPPPFFLIYPHYIVLEIAATTRKEFCSWRGWCESQLRILAKSMEPVCFHSQVYCQPFPDAAKDLSENYYVGFIPKDPDLGVVEGTVKLSFIDYIYQRAPQRTEGTTMSFKILPQSEVKSVIDPMTVV